MKSIKRLFMGAGMGLILILTGQSQVIENPDKPKAPEAGRVIVPKEVLTIEDTGDQFFFKYPRNLKIGPDGSIVVTDSEQVIHFDKNGRFLRNYFKKGQGPGEMTQSDQYDFPEVGGLVIHSYAPPKMMWFDGAGKLGQEITLAPKYQRVSLLGRAETKWIFETFEFPRQEGAAKYVELPHQLVLWDERTNEWTPLSSFNATVFAASSGGGGGFFDIANFQGVNFGPGLMAVSHTQEYLIKIFQPSSNSVVREFRRAYKRTAPLPLKVGQKPPQINLNGKIYEPPERKYANDISALQAFKNRIWAVTSTFDKDKGILVDEYDGDGIYRDAFYLKMSEAALTAIRSSRTSVLTGDAIFTIERTEEGTYVIKKYALK
jgi:hypothetical protein